MRPIIALLAVAAMALTAPLAGCTLRQPVPIEAPRQDAQRALIAAYEALAAARETVLVLHLGEVISTERARSWRDQLKVAAAHIAQADAFVASGAIEQATLLLQQAQRLIEDIGGGA